MSSSEPDPLPSLELVLDVLRSGRDDRREHFDALDQKAGLALGFAGVLVTLSNDITQPWATLGVLTSVLSAALAVWSFAPRRYDVLDNVRQYMAASPTQTRLVLIDTLLVMNLRADQAMGVKARRLQLALIALVSAVAMLGIGVISSD